ncbi:MAG: UDP-N-acetylmuramate dehydrogenase [bacterium]|nr:UDP-N-acetylmuramate dehydrogenase [bacterium]
MTDKLKTGLPEVKENEPMAAHTTFNIGGPARYFFVARSSDDVVRAVTAARAVGIPFFIMGGASNILVSDKGFDGLVIRSEIFGCSFTKDGDQVIATVGAGEIWDDFVAQCVERDLAGVECLSGIPGTVGAAPVQNIGAYGQSASDIIFEVCAIDSKTNAEVRFDRAECEFGYRESIFKREAGRFIITQVTFAFKQNGVPTIMYRDLIEYFHNSPTEGRSAALHVPLSHRNSGASERQAPALQSGQGEGPTLKEVRKAVIEIRARKGYLIMPEYECYQTAGSFFKNPVISKTQFQKLQPMVNECPGVWYWPQGNGDIKVSAACLLQSAGFQKGYRKGNAGISPKHSLSLMNYGGATATEIVALFSEIQTAVREKFEIELVPEVQWIGF